VFGALGDVDEASCAIGLLLAELQEKSNSGRRVTQEAEVEEEEAVRIESMEDVAALLCEIQARLLDVGSAIATPRAGGGTEAKLALTAFSHANVDHLERAIDAMDAQLPPLRNFILPGGSRMTAQAHHARAVVRRAERAAAPLAADGSIDDPVYKYLNRLSDVMFVVARWISAKEGVDEIVYKKARKRRGE
jgi:ATP:cob(I)alamin adenosyltransferase